MKNIKEYLRISANNCPIWQSDISSFFTFDARKPEAKGRYEGWMLRLRMCLPSGFFSLEIIMQHPYSEIDFTATFLKLRQYVEKHNNKLKETNPRAYRKLCIKSTHVETAKEIIRFYGAFLINNKKKQLDPNRPFVISQTRVGKHKMANQVTIYRHVKILQEVGVITNKDLQPCQSGIQVCINVEILAKKGTKGKKTLTTATLRPNDTDLHNVNISGSFVDSDLKSKKRWKQSQKQGSGDHYVPESAEQGSESEKKPETLETGQGGRAARPEEMWISAYASDAWQFSKTILYPDKSFTSLQEEQTKNYIREYFAGIPFDEYYSQNIQTRFQDFGQRVLLTKAYLDKSPERFVPLPWIWFNKHFEGGFRGTYTWMKGVRERRKKNKDYYSNLALLTKLYRQYKDKPTLENYKKAEENLKLKQDGKLWELFNQCVLGQCELNSESLQHHFNPNPTPIQP